MVFDPQFTPEEPKITLASLLVSIVLMPADRARPGQERILKLERE
jgi:hypothetical protein